MAALAAQPAKEHAHQHAGVQPVRLCPMVFARDRDTPRMDDVHFDPSSPQPPHQPEPVAPRLVGEGDASDRSARPRRLGPPAFQQPPQPSRIRLHFLDGLPLDAGKHSRHQPARRAQFDHHDQRGILTKRNEAAAQVIQSRHSTLHSQ